jgi:hypothetical protein
MCLHPFASLSNVMPWSLPASKSTRTAKLTPVTNQKQTDFSIRPRSLKSPLAKMLPIVATLLLKMLPL